MRLAGKTALITGGNSGIGLATARLFVQEGARVVITGRDQQTLDAAAAELAPHAIAVRADISDASARSNLFQEVQKQLGWLDILFANAGISGRTPLGGTEEQVFSRILNINLNSVFFTVQEALPLLKDGASILLTGSVLSALGQPGTAAYAASKAGLGGMTRVLASELAPRGIRVNLLSPGATETPIWSRGAVPPDRLEKTKRALSAAIPLGRWAEAEEVARVALFLASGEAAYITAAELFVDGGAVGAPFGAAVYRPEAAR